MRKTHQKLWVFFAVVLAWLFAAPAVYSKDSDYKIDRELIQALSADENATAAFFVVFGERPNLAKAFGMKDRAARAKFVVQSLEETAKRSQTNVRALLEARGVPFKAFWVENKLYVPQGTMKLARELSRRPEVVAILPEVIYTIPYPIVSGGASTLGVGWNISKIEADQAWSTADGEGMVVANIDTGVQYDHPAVVNQYRGNTGSGFSHVGNWKDPANICGGTPCDNHGHGTHTMGTMLGNDGATNQIGVAPGAKWIACKGCESGSCSSSSLIACAQWVMDPYENSSGAGEPDVVNNSWGGGSGSTWYRSYMLNWRAAGIFPAFSAGNSGPSCGTANSPGDNAEAFASGATDSSDNIAGFSSRGPSSVSGVGIKPEVSAPGVSVRSSVPTNSYASWSGTSMASPHTAGTVALVWSAAPGYRGNIGATEELLMESAVPRTSSETCGGVAGSAVPNNTYGWGRLDALGAVNAAVGTPVNQPPVVTLGAPKNGDAFPCPATVDFSGTASDPEDGSLNGSISWSDNGSVFGSGASSSKSYTCAQAGNHNIGAKVTDSGGASDTDSITINVVSDVPAAPSGLTATANGSSVTLNWVDNSNNELGFTVERLSGKKWAVRGTLGADVTTFTESPGRGTWKYRVSAFNASGTSAPTNIVTIRVKAR